MDMGTMASKGGVATDRRALETLAPNIGQPTTSVNEKYVKELCSRTIKIATKASHKLQDFSQFHSALAEIQKYQQDPFGDEPERDEAVKPFLRWCRRKGIVAKGIAVAAYPDAGLGLLATRTLEADERIIRVPWESVVSSKEAVQLFGQLVQRANIDSSWLQVYLALLLIHERVDPESEWRSYLGVLPKSCPGHPLYYTPAEFARLKGTKFYGEGLNLYYEMACQYACLYKEIYHQWVEGRQYGNITPENFTFEAYRWALTVALSRSLRATEPDGETVTVLVPFWDLCNHGEEALTSRVELHPDAENPSHVPGLYAYATRKIEAGEQLFICYNENSSAVEYFTVWGLIIDESQG